MNLAFGALGHLLEAVEQQRETQEPVRLLLRDGRVPTDLAFVIPLLIFVTQPVLVDENGSDTHAFANVGPADARHLACHRKGHNSICQHNARGLSVAELHCTARAISCRDTPASAAPTPASASRDSERNAAHDESPNAAASSSRTWLRFTGTPARAWRGCCAECASSFKVMILPSLSHVELR